MKEAKASVCCSCQAKACYCGNSAYGEAEGEPGSPSWLLAGGQSDSKGRKSSPIPSSPICGLKESGFIHVLDGGLP